MDTRRPSKWAKGEYRDWVAVEVSRRRKTLLVSKKKNALAEYNLEVGGFGRSTNLNWRCEHLQLQASGQTPSPSLWLSPLCQVRCFLPTHWHTKIFSSHASRRWSCTSCKPFPVSDQLKRRNHGLQSFRECLAISTSTSVSVLCALLSLHSFTLITTFCRQSSHLAQVSAKR